MNLEYIQYDSAPEPEHLVVWLHGLGADGHDFEPIIPELAGSFNGGARWILPHAPVRAVTVNGGMGMRAWYDILAPDLTAGMDTDGIAESVAQIDALVSEQWGQGFAPGKTVLAGFSQGGLIALAAGLGKPDLAGIIALSTYYPEPLLVPAASHFPPVFQAHGSADPIIPPTVAAATTDRLRAAGVTVLAKDYPMEHSVSAQEIADLNAWLGTLL